ncbi:hypothetical protein J6590_071090 [Homalodisca vitripennis]|nr:hypothetical protein J6590_071090 [Homalodisca vitripennis]
MVITVEEVSSKTADNAESAPACAGKQSSSGLRLVDIIIRWWQRIPINPLIGRVKLPSWPITGLLPRFYCLNCAQGFVRVRFVCLHIGLRTTTHLVPVPYLLLCLPP